MSKQDAHSSSLQHNFDYSVESLKQYIHRSVSQVYNIHLQLNTTEWPPRPIRRTAYKFSTIRAATLFCNCMHTSRVTREEERTATCPDEASTTNETLFFPLGSGELSISERVPIRRTSDELHGWFMFFSSRWVQNADRVDCHSIFALAFR
jgi:hypothetical protein